MEINDLANAIIKELGLKKSILIKFSKRPAMDWDALYTPIYEDRLISHRIVLCTTDNSRDVFTLLVHELIHAKQEELGIAENHGRVFRKYARRFAKAYGLKNIYLAGVDEE